MLNDNTYTIIWHSASFSTFAGVLLFLSEMRQSCPSWILCFSFTSCLHKTASGNQTWQGKEHERIKFEPICRWLSYSNLWTMISDCQLCLPEGLWQLMSRFRSVDRLWPRDNPRCRAWQLCRERPCFGRCWYKHSWEFDHWWWFQTFVIFPYIGNNHPNHLNWLIFFRGVETTNQTMSKRVFGVFSNSC